MTDFYLDWDVVHEGQPSSTWVFLGMLGVAIVVLIARSVISRRISRRTDGDPRRFRRIMAVLSVVVVVGAVLTAAGLEGASHYREHQQADFIDRELGITVHDALQLTGFHSRTVTFDIDRPAPIHGCTLKSYFIDRHGDLKSSKPGRGDGAGRLGMFISCPQAINTPAAQHELLTQRMQG